MRIFIALLFEKENKNIIHDILGEVKYVCEKGNFTSYGNLHLTLVYIGETSKAELDKIKIVLSKINQKKFKYLTDRIKYFKKSGNKKIVYLGLQKSIRLEQLYHEVAHNLNEIGYNFHLEKYTPHITLGREILVKNNESLHNIYCNPLELKADRISVMESKRVDNQLVYEEIFSIPLT
jgi:2'-5' RNA ligase